MSLPRTLLPRLVFCLSAALSGCQSAHVLGPLLESSASGEAGTNAIETGRITDLDLTVGIDWQAGFSVTTESYLQLVVEQRNLDVGIQVIDSRGHALLEVDGPGGVGVDERLAIRLAAGDYGVIVRPRPDGPTNGRVRLRVEALRPFGEQDTGCIRLIRLGHEATHLDGSSSQRDWQQAYRLSIEELAGWRLIGESEAVIRTLNRMVSLERAFGELKESILHGEDAVRLSLDAGLDAAEATSRYWLAQSLHRAGRGDEASTELDLGLAAAQRADDLLLQGRILNWQGRQLASRGDLQPARRLYQRALDLRRKAHDTRGIGSIVNNLAIIAERLGEFSLAVELYREAVEEANQLGNPGAALLSNSNLSTLLVARGQWQEALDSFTAGLEIARATDDQRNESILGTKLAYLLLTLGEPEPARLLLERSLELDEARQDGSAQTYVLSALARLELGLGNLEEAEAWMLRAYDLSTRLELSAQNAQAVRGLAALRREQNRPRLALELLEPAVEQARVSNQPIRLAMALKSLGETYLELDDAAEGLRQFDLAREALTGMLVPEIRFDISYLIARARYAEGDLDAAVAEVERALTVLETLRLSVDDPDLRATFLSRTREAFDFAVGRLLELDRKRPGEGFDRRAFATLERGRARSLVEMLSRARAGAERGLDAALLEAERSALASVTEASKRLNRAAAEGRTEDLALLNSQLDSQRNRLTQAEEALTQAEPRYASLRYAESYAVEDLQAMLRPGVALVEYSLQPHRSVAFVVSRDDFVVLDLAAEEIIQAQAASFRATLTSPNRRAYATLLSRARQLGDLVVAPLREALEGKRQLIVVPDGALAYIPFEALRLDQEDSDEDIYLIETWATSYSPSAGVLRSLLREQQQPSRGSGLVAFADPRPPLPLGPRTGGVTEPTAAWRPLPGARHEVAAIAASIGDQQTTAYVDAEATEHDLKWNPIVGRARWIHLATHARIDYTTPADSAIVLAPSPGEDGYLTVQEIFALELEAELVVLSGCETALGRQIRGEGLIGLTRAFLYAGARGIQVSLWKVADDTTPALMASFYVNLAQDMGAAEALRAAKLDNLGDPRRSHPFYWAPFVLIGS